MPHKFYVLTLKLEPDIRARQARKMVTRFKRIAGVQAVGVERREEPTAAERELSIMYLRHIIGERKPRKLKQQVTPQK